MTFFLIVLVLFLTTPAWSFDLTRHSVPIPALSTGGVPKDAIPAIENPAFIPQEKADSLILDELEMGVVITACSRMPKQAEGNDCPPS